MSWGKRGTSAPECQARLLPAHINTHRHTHTEKDRPHSTEAPEGVQREDWPQKGTVWLCVSSCAELSVSPAPVSPPLHYVSKLLTWCSTLFCRWIGRSFVCAFPRMLWPSSNWSFRGVEELVLLLQPEVAWRSCRRKTRSWYETAGRAWARTKFLMVSSCSPGNFLSWSARHKRRLLFNSLCWKKRSNIKALKA